MGVEVEYIELIGMRSRRATELRREAHELITAEMRQGCGHPLVCTVALTPDGTVVAASWVERGNKSNGTSGVMEIGVVVHSDWRRRGIGGVLTEGTVLWTTSTKRMEAYAEPVSPEGAALCEALCRDFLWDHKDWFGYGRNPECLD